MSDTSDTSDFTNLSMALSWDGILCTSCRRILDSLGLTEDGTDFDEDPPFVAGHWQSFDEACISARSCRLCEFVTRHSNGQELLRRTERCLSFTARLLNTITRIPYVLVQIFSESNSPQRPGVDIRVAIYRPKLRRDSADEGPGHDSFDSQLGSPISQAEPPSDIHITSALVQRWLAACSSHSRCQQWMTDIGLPFTTPTRLIEISHADQAYHARLVDGQQISGDDRRYATLSHCWGNSHLFKLTQSNIESLKAGMDIWKLSLTFREAILFAKELGLHYIWIDALCIVQDDHEDWLRESAMMTSVYANSWLNLSADDSSSGEGGLFRRIEQAEDLYGRRAPECAYEKVNTDHVIVPTRQANNVFFVCYDEFWDLLTLETPLSKRGWVLQERFLAPKIVHFTRAGVLWECASMTASQPMPDDFDHGFGIKSSYDVGESASRKSNIHGSWRNLAVAYASGQFTRSTDRPIAISGMAKAFCHQLGLSPNDYCYGLWRDQLVGELCWNTEESVTTDDTGTDSTKHLPSWSWLSLAQIQPFDLKFPHDAWSHHKVMEVVDVQLARTDNLFGNITSANLKVRGRLCPAVLCFTPGKFSYPSYEVEVHLTGRKSQIANGNLSWISVMGYLDTSRSDGSSLTRQEVYLMAVQLEMDDARAIRKGTSDLVKELIGDDEWIMGENAWIDDYTRAVLSYDYCWTQAASSRIYCLILLPAGDNTFRRIGILIISGKYEPVRVNSRRSTEASGLTDPNSSLSEQSSCERDEYQSEEKAQCNAFEMTGDLHGAIKHFTRCVALAQSFRADNVPHHLCESVDSKMVYTFNIA